MQSFREYVLSRWANFFEGAWSNQGLFWISPKGNTHSVPEHQSHEEWATEHHDPHGGRGLEKLLRKGWIRVQSISPRYLFINHEVRHEVPSEQAEALAHFFFDGNQLKEYNEYVMDCNHNMQEFGKDNGYEAFKYATTGELQRFDSEESIVQPTKSGKAPKMPDFSKPSWDRWEGD